MGLFDKFKKGKPEAKVENCTPAAPETQPDRNGEYPVLYEESGGVTRAQAVEIIQGLAFAPNQSPMGVAGGEQNYGLIAYPDFILIFFNQDKDHLMKIEKHEFMPLECIMAHVDFYTSRGDFVAAANCVTQAIEGNHRELKNWNIYCVAGEIFWRIREIEMARNMFLTAYKCEDCDQKAHVLCQAAATSCILRDLNTGYGLYHKALEEESDSLEALHDLGGFHWDVGELDKAAEYYFSVLKKDPAYYASYEELSNLFRQLGDTVWPDPFMTSFTQKRPLPPDRLAAAEQAMLSLLAQQKKQ